VHISRKVKSLSRQADFASWQFVSLYSIFSKVIFSKKTSTIVGRSTVFTWFVPMRHFHVPKTKFAWKSLSLNHLKTCRTSWLSVPKRLMENNFWQCFQAWQMLE
jgi:hypothetical protein